MYVCPNCSNRNFLIACACGCNNIITSKNDHYYVRRYISGHNGSRWKGGTTINTDGYVMMRNRFHPFADNNHGYVMMHRLVYEKAHKCILLPWANVHHINGIKTDNRIENLEAMTRSQHTTLELIMRHKQNVH